MKLIDYYSTILYVTLGVVGLIIYNTQLNIWVKVMSILMVVVSFYLVYQKEQEIAMPKRSERTNLEPPLPEEDLISWLR